MRKVKKSNNSGFSLLELLVAMTVILVLLGLTAGLLASSFRTRARESRKTDALAAARAAISVMSREIANSGYGMAIKENDNYTPMNGIIVGDSNKDQIHFQSNIENTNICARDRGEDVMYFFDDDTQSIVRHERYWRAASSTETPCDATAISETETSVVVNRISSITYRYFNYDSSSSVPLQLEGTATPTANTGRVRITVEVRLEEVLGQATNQKVVFTSEVTLRNSEYMLNQY
jgi:prepilin-type N-terminal cleavage/methylation domain-containing protein